MTMVFDAPISFGFKCESPARQGEDTVATPMRDSHSRPSYAEALAQSGVLTRLAAFDPHVAGTPPLGLDLPDSDIDILCHAPDPQAFAVALWESYRDRPGF